MTDQTSAVSRSAFSSVIRGAKLIIGAGILGAGGFAAGIYFSEESVSPAEEVLRLIERGSPSGSNEEATEMERVRRDVPEEEAFVTSYYEFEAPLTTNLNGSRRFLQVTVAVSTQYDDTVIENVTTHAMALRSDMLAVISGFTEEDVQNTEGRERLSSAMREVVNARLERLTGFGGIEDIFFPSFVLQ